MKLLARTKIIATIGPASQSKRKIAGLISAGMRIARLNFSHGTHDDHARSLNLIREAAHEAGRHIAILIDLQGPKIRTGRLKGGQAQLSRSGVIELTVEDIEGDESRVSVSYAGLPNDVHPGESILLDDGAIKLRAEKVTETSVFCRILTPGILKERKGVNIPGAETDMPSLTEKDIVDLDFAVEHDIDFIALSFVRKAADIHELKQRLAERGAHIPVIAKLEKPQAINAIDEILEASDGVMVARGDLGVELSLERVPMLQKTLIDKANRANKPVITATQMLESMIWSPRPTRAEASDVANAILDGTDAVMLSGETAVGKYPIEAVQNMNRIAAEAEKAYLRRGRRRHHLEELAMIDRHSGTHAIGHAACQAAEDLETKAIVCFSWTGETSLLISKFRPRAPIIAVVPNDAMARRCQLYWGVRPQIAKIVGNTDELLAEMERAALASGLARDGDSIVMTAGVPFAGEGRTNFMKIHRLGELGLA